jgi:hypothetical protein
MAYQLGDDSDVVDFQVDDSPDMGSNSYTFSPDQFSFDDYQQAPAYDWNQPNYNGGQWQNLVDPSQTSGLPEQFGTQQGLPDVPSSVGGTENGFNLGSISQTLQGLFSGRQGENMTRGLAALLEGYQNKKKAAGIQNIVNQNRQTLDPFGSQRPQYQQELSRAVTDPYSAPIVANQVNQIADAQARKDAAAGRRSNSAGSAPAVLAAQAKVAQDYINSLYTPSGANIAPQGSAILSALMQGNNADVNGYLSPIMSALGYGQKQMTLDDIKALLSSGGK